MTTYEEIINNLKDIKTVVEFYRFQGASSFEYYNIKSNHFDNDSNHYVYFSITENHHYYFTVRRIRQLINTIILRNSPYNISNKCLKDDRAFHYIENLVINSDSLRKLNSIALVCDSIYYELLKDNSIYNIKKKTPNLIERVDRKIYGGGYGVSSTWLDLFDSLTLFSSYTRITNEDVFKLVKNMKKDGKVCTPYLIRDILSNKERVYKISSNLYNSFHKYEIINSLEEIYDKKLYLESTIFATNPTKVINEVLCSYQKNRDKVLVMLDDKYHKYY